MQLVVCDDIHEITTNAKLIGKNLFIKIDFFKIFYLKKPTFLENFFRKILKKFSVFNKNFIYTHLVFTLDKKRVS